MYAPGYDLLGKMLDNSRKFGIELAQLTPDEKVLIVGAGTGLDLLYLPENISVTATDITPAMITLLKRRSLRLNRPTEAFVMDGQRLDFSDASFDVVLLHLILAVIPDPVACIREAERVLKPGGRMIVFDKFVRTGKAVSWKRRLINTFTTVMFSDITRHFEPIAAQTQLNIMADYARDFGGNFRVILLKKAH